ncbi:O-antigen ligase [Flavobacterium sp. 90]|uniref:O-antigen ligase family protein n=1 Tax=unclassified Flavobacterium TaxID=196869 RepID=UPI000EAE740B|nr:MULTISPECIES: O-antigen ligase family protein [unclassified Flavobacterium]RKR05121.1 O-antigen ligase [Flavobacterium sp. 81]TCK56436.1 O-antigen ligase [Flavobacterium sp. 90]
MASLLTNKLQEYNYPLLLLCFILMHINISYFIPNFLNASFFSICFVIVLFLVELYTYVITTRLQSVKLHLLDLVVLLFYGYIFVNNLFSNTDIFSEAFFEFSAVFCVYFIVRQSKISYSEIFSYLQFTAVSILFIESIYCFLQSNNMIPNLNSNYTIGGSYGHPAFTAISISILTPYIIQPLKKYTFRIICVKILIPLILIMFLIYNLKSRAALISVILSLTVIVALTKIKITNKVKFGISAFFIGLLVYLITFVKSDSSLGRIFIWKKCLAIIPENLFFGVGFGRFAFEYNKYQSLYFLELSDRTKESFLADYSESAFNEFFQLGVEMGLLGIAFLLALMICLFYFKDKNSLTKPFFNGVFWSFIPLFLGWSVLRYFPIGCFFFVGLALLSKQIRTEFVFNLNFKNKLPIKFISFSTVILAGLFIYNRAGYIAINWSIQNDKKPNYALNLSSAFSELQYSDRYIYKYCDFLIEKNDYKRAAFVAENSNKWLNSPALYHYLYRIHFERKEYKKAIKDLDYLINISPSKIYPKYALAKLYYSSGNKSKADSLTKEILKIKPKIINADVILMKEELKTYLNKNN